MATNDAKKAAERDTKKVIEREPREPGNIINNFHELIFAKYDHFFSRPWRSSYMRNFNAFHPGRIKIRPKRQTL